MIYTVEFTPTARAQIDAIFDYISKAASPQRAQAFTDDIVDYCESFTTFPQRGTLRPDLDPGLRLVGFRRRVTIAFKVSGTIVRIIGLYYGGRQFESLLRQ